KACNTSFCAAASRPGSARAHAASIISGKMMTIEDDIGSGATVRHLRPAMALPHLQGGAPPEPRRRGPANGECRWAPHVQGKFHAHDAAQAKDIRAAPCRSRKGGLASRHLRQAGGQ